VKVAALVRDHRLSESWFKACRPAKKMLTFVHSSGLIHLILSSRANLFAEFIIVR